MKTTKIVKGSVGGQSAVGKSSILMYITITWKIYWDNIKQWLRRREQFTFRSSFPLTQLLHVPQLKAMLIVFIIFYWWSWFNRSLYYPQCHPQWRPRLPPTSRFWPVLPYHSLGTFKNQITHESVFKPHWYNSNKMFTSSTAICWALLAFSF